MPQYSDLSANSQAAIDELLNQVRPLAHEIYHFAQKNRVPTQLWFSNPPGEASTLANIVNTLTANAQLPNKTNLAGADAVSKEALQTLMGYISTIAGHDTTNHLNVMLPFCGSGNL